MLTKAKLERKIKSLKLQLTNALAKARSIPDEEAVEVIELQLCNENLYKQLHAYRGVDMVL